MTKVKREKNAGRLGRIEDGMGTLAHAVGVLKQDVSVLKQDVGGLKQDVGGLKQDVSDIRSVNHRIVSTLIRLEEKVDDMGERMATKDDLRLIQSRLDDFTVISHQKRLDDHELRITRLERPKN